MDDGHHHRWRRIPGDQNIPVTTIQRALEAAGVEFIEGGVKLKEIAR